VALPRVRDFKGLSNNAFDGHGNYSIGIKEQIIFTEVNYDDVKRVRGFDVTLVTSTSKDEHAHALLKAIGLPFAKQN
jgi:large subunit ribosomal protein L5